MINSLRHPDIRNVAVYGIATAAAAVLTLVQTRVLWHALLPADFGIWTLIDPMLVPCASLVLFGIEYAIVKQIQSDGGSLRVVTGTLLVSTLPATMLCLVIMYVVSHFVFRFAWIDVLLLAITGEALILVVQSAFRATGSVLAFSAVLLTRNLLYLAILLFASFYGGGSPFSVRFVFLARGGCVIFLSLIATAVLRPILRPNQARYFDAVRYGFHYC